MLLTPGYRPRKKRKGTGGGGTFTFLGITSAEGGRKGRRQKERKGKEGFLRLLARLQLGVAFTDRAPGYFEKIDHTYVGFFGNQHRRFCFVETNIFYVTGLDCCILKKMTFPFLQSVKLSCRIWCSFLECRVPSLQVKDRRRRKCGMYFCVLQLHHFPPSPLFPFPPTLPFPRPQAARIAGEGGPSPLLSSAYCMAKKKKCK